jgi:hypothetical protein
MFSPFVKLPRSPWLFLSWNFNIVNEDWIFQHSTTSTHGERRKSGENVSQYLVICHSFILSGKLKFPCLLVQNYCMTDISPWHLVKRYLAETEFGRQSYDLVWLKHKLIESILILNVYAYAYKSFGQKIFDQNIWSTQKKRYINLLTFTSAMIIIDMLTNIVLANCLLAKWLCHTCLNQTFKLAKYLSEKVLFDQKM